MTAIKEKAIRMILNMSEDDIYNLMTMIETLNSRKSKDVIDSFNSVEPKTNRGRLSKYANPGHQAEEKLSFEMEMATKHANMD